MAVLKLKEWTWSEAYWSIKWVKEKNYHNGLFGYLDVKLNKIENIIVNLTFHAFIINCLITVTGYFLKSCRSCYLLTMCTYHLDSKWCNLLNFRRLHIVSFLSCNCIMAMFIVLFFEVNKIDLVQMCNPITRSPPGRRSREDKNVHCIDR